MVLCFCGFVIWGWFCLVEGLLDVGDGGVDVFVVCCVYVCVWICVFVVSGGCLDLVCVCGVLGERGRSWRRMSVVVGERVVFGVFVLVGLGRGWWLVVRIVV